MYKNFAATMSQL